VLTLFGKYTGTFERSGLLLYPSFLGGSHPLPKRDLANGWCEDEQAKITISGESSKTEIDAAGETYSLKPMTLK